MREECNTNNVVLDHHQSLPFSTAEKTLRTVLRCNVVMAQPGSSSPDHQPSSIPTHDFLQPLDRKALPGLPSLMRVVAPHSTLGQPSGISSNMVFCMDAASARINGPAESLESWLSWQSNPSSSEHYCMPTATAIHLMSGNGQHQEPSRTKQRGSLHSECYEMGSSKLLIVSSEEDHVDLRHADNNLLDQKKESIIIKGDSVMQKFDEKTNEDKLNTARSRHSATEQRRRSKINDRFEMLRRLVPNNDQKRDKASLLLEAIEYIQLLHEKVRKFERREPQQENNETRGPPNDMRPTIEARLPIGSKLTNLDSLNTEPQVSSSSALIPNIERVNGENKASSTETKDSVISSSNIKAIARDSKSPLFISREEDKQATNQETINVQSGSISLSSSYSQGLLENLTNALQSSGLDLSHASISVQIDLGSSGGITRSDFSRAESKMNIEQTEKSRGDGRKAETSPESGIQNKKPKLEIDS